MLVVTENDEQYKRSLAAWEERHATALHNIKNLGSTEDLELILGLCEDITEPRYVPSKSQQSRTTPLAILAQAQEHKAEVKTIGIKRPRADTDPHTVFKLSASNIWLQGFFGGFFGLNSAILALYKSLLKLV